VRNIIDLNQAVTEVEGALVDLASYWGCSLRLIFRAVMNFRWSN
jgi:hypothetical protein